MNINQGLSNSAVNKQKIKDQIRSPKYLKWSNEKEDQ